MYNSLFIVAVAILKDNLNIHYNSSTYFTITKEQQSYINTESTFHIIKQSYIVQHLLVIKGGVQVINQDKASCMSIMKDYHHFSLSRSPITSASTKIVSTIVLVILWNPDFTLGTILLDFTNTITLKTDLN